jgi:hypothetical protein
VSGPPGCWPGTTSQNPLPRRQPPLAVRPARRSCGARAPGPKSGELESPQAGEDISYFWHELVCLFDETRTSFATRLLAGAAKHLQSRQCNLKLSALALASQNDHERSAQNEGEDDDQGAGEDHRRPGALASAVCFLARGPAALRNMSSNTSRFTGLDVSLSVLLPMLNM